MNPILQITNLSKYYGKRKAVNELSLTINEGNVYGLLGPNGSGKTTTLGIILNVIQPSSGTYAWFGKPPRHESRKNIGAILESPAFYPYLSAEKNLAIVAKIKDKGKDRIAEVLRQVNLYERRQDPFRTFSLGMKQRLSIASALLTDPSVLIFDEPTNGLDPQGIAEIRQLILAVAAQGKTILIASHILDEVQKVCSHFAVLKFGKKIYEGSVKEAMASTQCIELAANDMEGLKNTLTNFQHLVDLQTDDYKLIVKLNGHSDSTTLHQYLIERGIVLSHLAEQKSSLEQKFLNILATSDDPTH